MVSAWSSSLICSAGGGIVKGPSSSAGGSPCPSPPNPTGSCSLGLVKYCLRASFQLIPYHQWLVYLTGSLYVMGSPLSESSSTSLIMYEFLLLFL